MTRVPDDQVMRSLLELLAIAKVAMPDFLYDMDPRVQRALQLLARLSDRSDRPPSIRLATREEMLDLAPVPTLETVERIRGAEPPWDITAGLDAFMASPEAPATRSEAVVMILREWLTAAGYLDLPNNSAGAH